LLVGGGDASVAEQMSHGVTVSQPSDTGGCATLISDTGSGRPLTGMAAGERRLWQKRPFLDAPGRVVLDDGQCTS
jgi:hypothetical protein